LWAEDVKEKNRDMLLRHQGERTGRYEGAAMNQDEKKIKAEQELWDREERYRTLFEQSPEGIVVIDPKTQLSVDFNDAAFIQLNYTREEFAKLSLSDYEAEETPEKTKARIEKILLIGRDDFETRHRTKDRDIRNVLVTVQTIELRGEPYLNCIFRDITEIRKGEEKLKERIEELERFKKATIKRELRMKEISDENERLTKRIEEMGKGRKNEG